MSRSRKKNPIIKDNADTGLYWRVIRREWKQKLHRNWDDPDLYLRNRREIINDYDYVDWRWYATVSDELRKNSGNVPSRWATTHEDVLKSLRK